MRIQWLLKDLRHSVPDVLHLVSGTIHDCFTDTLLEMKRNLGINLPVISKLLPGNLPKRILGAIQHILYLISENADIVVETEKYADTQKEKPSNSGKIKDNFREIREKNVGTVISSALEKSVVKSKSGKDVSSTGISKRPHLRRGHWHHYWKGTQSERELILKWTAPTIIHGKNFEDITTVIPVKQPKTENK